MILRRSISFIAASVLSVIIAVLLSACDSGEGMTPLMLAAHSGDRAALKAQLAEGVPVDARSRYGWTALIFASWKGHREQVDLLLDAGADPNIVSNTVPSGFETVGGHPPTTALRESIRGGYLAIARLLMDRGATPDAMAVALAGEYGDISFLGSLQSRGVDWNKASGSAFVPTALCSAAADGKRENVTWLLRHGAKPNVIAEGATALIEAAENDQVEIVRLLLNNGANPNLVPGGSSQESALFKAVTKYTDDRDYAANLAVIRLLLSHGADRNHRAMNGQHTALEFAKIQRENGKKYLDTATGPKILERHRASQRHHDATIRLLEE